MTEAEESTMRKINLLIAAASALTLGAGAASAQAWLPIVERQAMLEDRIDAGLESGALTTADARMLRADLSALVALEGRYRYGGLTARERLDLDRRYAVLDDQVRTEVARADDGDLPALSERRAQLQARIDQGVNSGQLTSAEATALRDDFDAIADVEDSYRVDGMSASERADLARRYDDLADQIRIARSDGERVYGYNRY
jgi:hypothetical protein